MVVAVVVGACVHAAAPFFSLPPSFPPSSAHAVLGLEVVDEVVQHV